MSNDKTEHPENYTKFVQRAASLYHDMPQRTWSYANELHKYANIECTGITTLILVSAKSHKKLVIRFIHLPPGEKLLKDAIAELQEMF